MGCIVPVWTLILAISIVDRLVFRATNRLLSAAFLKKHLKKTLALWLSQSKAQDSYLKLNSRETFVSPLLL